MKDVLKKKRKHKKLNSDSNTANIVGEIVQHSSLIRIWIWQDLVVSCLLTLTL